MFIQATKMKGKGLAIFADLPNLKKLRLFGNSSDDDMKEFRCTKNLVGLDLAEVERLTDASLKSLKKLDSLASIGLAGTQISIDGVDDLISMKNLRAVDVRNTPLAQSKAGMKALLAGLSANQKK